MNLDILLFTSLVLVTISTVIGSAEFLVQSRQITDAFNWNIIESHYRILGHNSRPSRVLRLLSKVRDNSGLRSLVVIRSVCAIGAMVAFFPLPKLSAFAAFACIVCGVVLHSRLLYGLDGSDQMTNIVWAGLCAFLLTDVAWLREIGVAFIGLQFVLAYLTSGIAKLCSSEWRTGKAIPSIVSTVEHGNLFVSRLCQLPLVGWIVCWATISFEVFGPILGFLNVKLLLFFVVSSIFFHSMIAVVMKLNLFLWSFLAALIAYMAFVLTVWSFFLA